MKSSVSLPRVEIHEADQLILSEHRTGANNHVAIVTVLVNGQRFTFSCDKPVIDLRPVLSEEKDR